MLHMRCRMPTTQGLRHWRGSFRSAISASRSQPSHRGSRPRIACHLVLGLSACALTAPSCLESLLELRQLVLELPHLLVCQSLLLLAVLQLLLQVLDRFLLVLVAQHSVLRHLDVLAALTDNKFLIPA